MYLGVILSDLSSVVPMYPLGTSRYEGGSEESLTFLG